MLCGGLLSLVVTVLIVMALWKYITRKDDI